MYRENTRRRKLNNAAATRDTKPLSYWFGAFDLLSFFFCSLFPADSEIYCARDASVQTSSSGNKLGIMLLRIVPWKKKMRHGTLLSTGKSKEHITLSRSVWSEQRTRGNTILNVIRSSPGCLCCQQKVLSSKSTQVSFYLFFFQQPITIKIK